MASKDSRAGLSPLASGVLFVSGVGAALFGLAAWTTGPVAGAIHERQLAAAIERLDTRARAERLIEHEAFMGAGPGAVTLEQTIEAGEDLVDALVRAGATQADAQQALAALNRLIDPSALVQGKEVEVVLDGEGAGARLASLSFRAAPDKEISLSRVAATPDASFAAREVRNTVTEELKVVRTELQGSFRATAEALGATERELDTLNQVLAFDIDFERDLASGDRFELVFERSVDSMGRTVATGDMHFMAVETSEGRRAFYRFTDPATGKADWYDENGRSARKFLMRTPINGARLTSGFGMRTHPVLGFTAAHRGVDFAAPVGTPIFAAGDGVIERAGWFGAFGNYIRVGHARGYDTAYAHMSRIAPGIRVGSRVRQGQVIGFVGSTGRSTGPHLHFEVLRNDVHIDPARLRPTEARALSGATLEAFSREVSRIDDLRRRAQLSIPMVGGEAPRQVADAGANRATTLR
jgi:murein DD-endopeptidase MepM/ murein hydrolase activator NlpD